MENKRPLLSICIPTYNRAKVLERVLTQYVEDTDFDDDVEIVISDNASTDSTQHVCEEFAEKYHNILYYRNGENVKDLNFPRVLEKANGEYLKLMNDNNMIIHNWGLGYMKSVIKSKIETKPPIFFTSGNVFNCKKDEMIICEGISDFYLYLSFFVTAIHVFGTWREYWNQVENKELFSPMQLAQVDWAYQIVERKKNALLYNVKYFNGLDVGNRSGYNYFKVLVDNYYRILLPHLDRAKVPENIRKKERATYLDVQIKKRLIWKVTSPIIPTNQKFVFSGSMGILWKYYKRDAHFYLFIFKFPLFVINYLIIHILRTIIRVIK